MKGETRNEMPFGECPHCGHQWQMDDWYELGGGDSIDCPKCEQEIHITDREDTCMIVFAKPSAEDIEKANNALSVNEEKKVENKKDICQDYCCITCGEGDGKDGQTECVKSKRECGHHCNHSWTHDVCCWCGKEFGEEGKKEGGWGMKPKTDTVDGWYCPRCVAIVSGEHVTFHETHDPRCGGCGDQVYAAKERMNTTGGCVWSQDENGVWETTCENMHEFSADGPAENNHKYCPYCGKAIAAMPYEEVEG